MSVAESPDLEGKPEVRGRVKQDTITRHRIGAYAPPHNRRTHEEQLTTVRFQDGWSDPGALRGPPSPRLRRGH